MGSEYPIPSSRIDRQCYGPDEIRPTCEDCDWSDTRLVASHAEIREARAAIRAHVAETGHTVGVEVTSQEVYRAERPRETTGSDVADLMAALEQSLRERKGANG